MNAIEFKPEVKLSFEEILQGIAKLDTPALEDFSNGFYPKHLALLKNKLPCQK